MMDKEEFIKLINKAKVDEKGNLYIIQKIVGDEFVNEEEESGTHRVYFGTITTICEDLIEEHASETKDGFELYDRHFWNDDTLECKIVRKENTNE